MRGRLAVLALAVGATASPALGLEVLDAFLQITYEHRGVPHTLEDHTVPLLPDNACYTWYIQVKETGAPLTVVERMTLPGPGNWGTIETDPASATKVEQFGQIATTTLSLTTTAEGWFTHGWCVAAGDPLGQQSIAVSVEGEPLAAFHFEVVAPEKYAFPVRPMISPDRTKTRNW